MNTKKNPNIGRGRWPMPGRLLWTAGVLVTVAACTGESLTAPGGTETPPAVANPHRTIDRSDLRAEGNVVETTNGYQVRGALHVSSAQGETSFLNADLEVEFYDDGRVKNISGRAQVPSPHERIEFADPVQADIGFFSGAFLNAERDFNILLQDDTDYFVFNFGVTLEMRIATGDTGEDATKPIAVKAPLGGQVLLIMDFDDPMYYIYGAQDLIGSLGFGWSLNSRIPFAPEYPVENLGYFDGGSVRTGAFTVFKVLSVEGQRVDNEYTEVHLFEDGEFSPDLRTGYQMGFNGAMSLDLFLKDIVGIDIPIAAGSGGMWREVSTEDIFRGHAYVRGLTTNDFSWWPAFIPAKPVASLETSGFLTSEGDFGIDIAGDYGWELPSGTHAMRGSFSLSPEALTVSGAVQSGEITYTITGSVTADATTVGIVPPQQLLDAIAGSVDAEIDAQLAEREQAWSDLQEATADYEVELSLRGLRSRLPAIVDVARRELADGIAAALASHEGEVYYSQLRSHLYSADDAYYAELERLRAAALEIQDNQRTRDEIEAALRSVAARKIFSTRFTYRHQVLGVTVATYTVNVSERIMSDDQANTLINAADNVQYIEETSNRVIAAQEIYDAIPTEEIFQQLRDDLDSGAAVIPTLGEFGFTLRHDAPETLDVYADFGGERHEIVQVDVFSLDDVAASLGKAMLDTLIP